MHIQLGSSETPDKGEDVNKQVPKKCLQMSFLSVAPPCFFGGQEKERQVYFLSCAQRLGFEVCVLKTVTFASAGERLLTRAPKRLAIAHLISC